MEIFYYDRIVLSMGNTAFDAKVVKNRYFIYLKNTIKLSLDILLYIS
jgi:hypothetical protein